MQENDSSVFADDVVKEIINKYSDADKQLEGSKFSFTFVSSFSSKSDKMYVPGDTSCISSPNSLRYKKY